MTWKQFQQWCNERACDGCWGYQEALLCIDVMKMIRQLPFWKREKVWKQIKDRMMVEVITPTNQKIKELLGKEVTDNMRMMRMSIEECVDHLIANGVTLDNQVASSSKQVASSKWIPVTERLPEVCKEVLAYRFTGCEVDSCVSHEKAYWSYDPVSDYPVTHWMHLPPPPKGE